MARSLFLFWALLAAGISLYAQNSCNGVWGQYLVNQTFGQGNGTSPWYGPLTTYAPGAATSTTFVGAAGPPGSTLVDNYSGLVQLPTVAGQGWINVADHTGNPNGLMFLINAPSTAATVFFEYTMDDLCPNTTLKLSVWILNVNDPSLTTNPIYQYPNMTLQAVDGVTSAVLGTSESGDVPADEVWHQYSVIFNNGTSTSIKLQLVNNSVGSGWGNDLAIDDITVQPCVPESHILPKLNTTICQNTIINFNANVINSPYNPAEYQWQYSADNGLTWLNQGPASAATAYTFSTAGLTPGTYMVRFMTGPQGLTGNYNCVAVSDTSILEVAEFPHTTVDASVCLGNTYSFYGRDLGLAGSYDTLIKSGPADLCGTLYTLNLTVKPRPDVAIAGPGKQDLCTGDTLNLSVAHPDAGATYQWLLDRTGITGETGSVYKASSGGNYYVAGELDGCVDTSLRVQVNERAKPEARIIYDPVLLCTYDTLEFHAAPQVEGSFYNWAPEKAFRLLSGAEGPSVQGSFKEEEMVYLTVYSPYGCHATDSVRALVHACCQALVPTAFSPNNDGLNDYFNPALKPGQLLINLKIFDRYGKLVYDNGNRQKGWNGRYKNGDEANAGAYMYVMSYSCDDQKVYELKGDLTLLR